MISVIMATNRADEYLFKAIESILNQTFEEFELIIVTNGSNCDSIKASIVEKYILDKRIRVYSTLIPQLAFALNLAISKSNYNILARMDADDISHPDRLEKQFKFLKTYNFDMVGSSVLLIDEYGNNIKEKKYPVGVLSNRLIKFKNCFAHPTVMFSKSIFIDNRGYCGGFNSEDYDLWLRISRNNVKWGNVGECLLSYRIHSNSTQRSNLAYAECAGYSLREFILHKSFLNLLSLFIMLLKSFFLGRK